MRTTFTAAAISLLIVACIIFYAGRFDVSPQARTFVDRQGEVIGTIDPSYQGVKIWTPLSDIPRAIVAKTIRSEDRFFSWHRGINPFAILKAAAENIGHGRIIRGGSTITQQLAKNLIQEREGRVLPRTAWNKWREAIAAIGLEMRHSKAWILERYLNTVYYGRHAYGIAAAADVFFLKRPDELTDDEIDALVQLPKAPGRRGTFLRGHASPEGPPRPSAAGRHFIEYVQSQMAPGDGRRRIATTLDLALERRLEEAVRTVIGARAEGDPLLTAAVVVIDVKTGGILAMVGSRDSFDEEIDGAVNAAVALRQPGSALKPFTYFAAFARGFAPGSIVPDLPLSFAAAGIEEADGYAPQNFDRRFHGDLTMREALANSYNIPAVVTLDEVGLSFFHDLLRKFGFTTLARPPPHYGLAVTLGSGEVTLLELTSAYAALARGGAFLPYRFEAGTPALLPRPVIAGAAACAAQVTAILSDPDARLKAFGFNEAMTVEGHRVAIKTGTSYEHRDNWAVGYSPSVAVGVWVGHADGSPMDPASMTGAMAAAPLWHAAMENILRGRTPEVFLSVAAERAEALPARRVESAFLPQRPRRFFVTSPVANTVYRLHPYLPMGHQQIAAEAEVASDDEVPLEWYLDGAYLETTRGRKPRVFLFPEPGKHRLRVESRGGERQEIPFRVVDAEG